MKVLIWHDKHGDWCYDASTPEAHEAAAREICKALVEQGYIYHPGDEPRSYGLDQEMVALTDEQIEALPTKSLRDEAVKHKKMAAQYQREYQEDLDAYNAVINIVADKPAYERRWSRREDVSDERWAEICEKIISQYPGAIRDGDYVLQPITARRVLSTRDGYEYERFEVQDVWQADD